MIISHIQNGEIENAFNAIREVLEKNLSENNANRDFNLVFFRWNSLNNEFNRGIITKDDYRSEQVRIINALLTLLQLYEDLFPGDIVLPPDLNRDYQDVLKELAEELAFNYYSVSFGNRFQGMDADFATDIFTEEAYEKYKNDTSKRRNILLIGAGATVASCPYVPTGRILRSYLEEKYPIFKEESDHEEEDSSKFDTERYLSNLHQKLSDRGKAKLKDALNEIYNVRYLPTHFYEIIAHMFKHSFFDVIINFNFDELLDEALAEELGKSSHLKVISSADCKELEEIFIDGRLKTPVYIKILGTASDKSSLRFTHDNHFDIPPDIKHFITQWLSGEVPKPGGDLEQIRTNIVCVGFDPVRFNFFRFLKSNPLMSGSKWFHFNYKTHPSFEKMGISQYYMGRDAHGLSYERWIPMVLWKNTQMNPNEDFINPLADVFNKLWKVHIRGMFNAPFRPRNVARHEITSDIFYHAFDHKTRKDFLEAESIDNKYAEMRGYFRSARYYFERTVLEVGLSLCKNKGILEPEQVVHERVGHFYQKYVDRFNDRKNGRTDLADSKKPYEKTLFSLQDIFDLYDLRSDYHYAGDLLNLTKFDETTDYPDESCFNLVRSLGFTGRQHEMADFFNEPDHLHLLILFRFFRSLPTMEVLIRLEERLAQNTILKNYVFNSLVTNMKQIRESSTYDIKSRFNDPQILRFQSVNKSHILHTNLSLSYNFAEKFNYPNTWDAMLMIAERGKLMTNHFNVMGENRNNKENFIQSLTGKKMIVLACHEAIAEDVGIPELKTQSAPFFDKLKSVFKTKSNIEYSNMEYYFLPYWQHYYHCVIFLKKRERSKFLNRAVIEVDGENFVWEIVRSFYYFKPGFSNRINPILFPTNSQDPTEIKRIQRDQTWLLKTFYAYYLMALGFEKHGNSLPVIRPDLISFDEAKQIPPDFNKFLCDLG